MINFFFSISPGSFLWRRRMEIAGIRSLSEMQRVKVSSHWTRTAGRVGATRSTSKPSTQTRSSAELGPKRDNVWMRSRSSTWSNKDNSYSNSLTRNLSSFWVRALQSRIIGKNVADPLSSESQIWDIFQKIWLVISVRCCFIRNNLIKNLKLYHTWPFFMELKALVLSQR